MVNKYLWKESRRERKLEEERRESKGGRKIGSFHLRTNRKDRSWPLSSAENSSSTIPNKTLLAHQSSIASTTEWSRHCSPAFTVLHKLERVDSSCLIAFPCTHLNPHRVSRDSAEAHGSLPLPSVNPGHEAILQVLTQWV